MQYSSLTGLKKIFRPANLNACVFFIWLAATAAATADTAQVLPSNVSIETTGIVNSMARQDDGKIIAAGQFQLANGVSRWNLVRFNTDGTLDTAWNPRPDDEVRVVTVSGTNIYIGGTFHTVAGTARQHIAKLDYTTGAADPTWNPGAQDVVRAIVVSGNYIYAGGAFTSIGGLARTYVARLNAADGSADSTWSATLNGDLETLAVNASYVYIAGSFSTVDGMGRSYLARLSAGTGNCDPGWYPVPDWMPYTILLNGTDIYVGGGFTTINTIPHAYLAQLNATDGAPTVWTVDANAAVRSLTAFGDYMIVGGDFTTIGASPRAGFALVHFIGYTEITWTNGVNDRVFAAAVNGTSEAYIGGTFMKVGSAFAASVAKLDPVSGDLIPAFNARINSPGVINAIALQNDGKIVLGGSFTSVSGNGLTNLCRLNADYTLDAAFKPNPDATVRALATDDTGIYAGGQFHNLGGVPRKHIAKLSLVDGTVDATFWADTDDGAAADVYSLAMDYNALYVGGGFITIGGQGRTRIAKLYPADGSVDATFTLGANDIVYDMMPGNTSLLVAGAFTTIGGQGRDRIAKLNSSTGAADPAFTLGADGTVYSLAGEETEFYAGGNFTTIGGGAHNNIAKLNPDTGAEAPTFTASADTTVYDTAFTFYDLYIGGIFTNVSGSARHNLAQLDIINGAVAPWTADTDNVVGFVKTIVYHGAYLLVGGGFAEINGVSSPCFAVIARHPAPAVAITTPSDGQYIAALGTFDINASVTAATNISGIALTNVAFYANGSPIKTFASDPYGMTVTNVPQGSYTLTVRAWDSDGLCATSAPVTVIVSPLPVPADYDGDRLADPAVYVNLANPSVTGNWYAWFSGAQFLTRFGPYNPGLTGTPVTGDIDGDGIVDLMAVTGSSWYVCFSSANYATRYGPYDLGVAGLPAAGDIDGDRLADLIVVSGSNWYVWFSSSQYLTRCGPYDLGVAGRPATGDIDGDRLADLICVTGSNWYVWFSTSQYQVRCGPYDMGVAGLPATGDVDGDRLADLFVVNGSNWYVWFSTSQYQMRCGPFTLSAP